MNEGQLKSWAEQKFKDFQPLHSRQDRDYLAWKLKKSEYDTTIDAKTKKHGSDIEIISNDPRTNCDDVQSILSASDMQISVRMAETKGADKRSDIGELERLFYFLLQKADERLIRLIQLPLRESLIWYSLVRGWTAGRFLTYADNDGNVIPNYTALDPRWLVYETGELGLKRTAYKTYRSQEALEEEYEVKIKSSPWYKPWGDSKDLEVLDIWEDKGKKSKWNYVMCNGVFLKDPVEYKLRSMPILIMPISTRPPVIGVSGTSETEGYGDSIFAPTRDINGIKNRILSIVANHANLSLNMPMINYKTEAGRPIEKLVNVPGGVLELDMGDNKLEPVPIQGIPDSIVALLNELEASLRKGYLPDLSIGSPPQSGILQSMAKEQGDKTFNPQLRNLNFFYADMCRLIEEQLLDGGVGKKKIKEIKVEFEDEKKYKSIKVTPVDLKKDHIIEVKFTARTAYEQAETVQLALMLRDSGVPEGWIWEHVYKFQDPKGMQDLAFIELAEHSPELAPKKSVEAMMKYGRKDDAAFLIAAQFKVEEEEAVETQPSGIPRPPQVGVV